MAVCFLCGSPLHRGGGSIDDDSLEVDANDEQEEDQGYRITWTNAGLLTMGVGALVFAPCALAAAAGFGTGGIAAGSMAAATQASMVGGNVAAGSVFATLQSLGASGVFTTGMYSSAGLFGAGIAARNTPSRNEATKPTSKHDNNKEEELCFRCPYCCREFQTA